MGGMITEPDAENVFLSEDRSAVVIIDQTLLPKEKKHIELRTPDEIYNAIKSLQVRGAPAIGICAAYGIYVLSSRIETESSSEFYRDFKVLRTYLESSRPTAVNLSYALARMEKRLLDTITLSRQAILSSLLAEARKIQLEDMVMCEKIAENGLSLVKDGDGILTHCNAGPLATSVYGTGLGTLILGKKRGYNFHVYVDETRPLMQGSRLTAYELMQEDIDCTLICDNMASSLMKAGKINACFVGCDRVAANGDVANKIGTLSVAVNAKYYGIPFYVFCPSSTIDLNCKTGDDIVIEERAPEEITEKFFGTQIAPNNVKCFNPAFDVTPRSLITAIITEDGIAYE